MSPQTHQSDPRVLSRRTLEHDHRRLAELVAPETSVLDIGCGTGSIAAGAARTARSVVGADRDAALLGTARAKHPGVHFIRADALALPFNRTFDVVSAARTLQWISDPLHTLREMFRAARSGGRIVVLDYNHEDNAWDPEPPDAFRSVYNAFLKWRADRRWDNRMADHLARLLDQAGAVDIQAFDETRVSTPPDEETQIWAHVIDTVGPSLVRDGYIDETLRARAFTEYSEWIASRLRAQTLSMKAVVGRVP